MPVKVEVRLDVDSMAEFMIHRIYTSMPGIVSIALGVLNVGLVYAFYRKEEFLLAVLFVVFALLLLVGFPYYIRYRVEKMKDSRRFTETVAYEFTEEGITTTTSEDSGKASWSKFKRAISKKRSIILFDHQNQAVILPIVQLGEQYTPVVDMIFSHMPAAAVRIRRLDKKNEKDQSGGNGKDSDRDKQ